MLTPILRPIRQNRHMAPLRLILEILKTFQLSFYQLPPTKDRPLKEFPQGIVVWLGAEKDFDPNLARLVETGE